LDRLGQELAAVAAAGMKIVLRFCYNVDPDVDQDLNPIAPYGDANPAVTSAHIQQLAAVVNLHVRLGLPDFFLS
jgi:hypothetical protein